MKAHCKCKPGNLCNKSYSVVGSNPGDGAVVTACSFDEAFVAFILLDYEEEEHVEIAGKVRDEFIERPGVKVNDKTVRFGDYTVTRIS